MTLYAVTLMWVSLLLSTRGVTSRFQRSVCEQAQPTTNYPNEPPLPQIPDTFEVHVDCAIHNRNMSTEVREYYDYDNNRGVLHQVQGGLPFYLYYNYNSKEILSIFPTLGTCFVDSLTSDKNTFLLGYKFNNGSAHIFTPSGALHFGYDDQISTYLGPGLIRDIKVRTWYFCQYMREFDATVNVYWSFNDPNNWDTAVGYPDTPVRCHITGIAADREGNGTHTFDHTYDFLHFKNFISRPDIFDTPDGIICPGRINTKTMPTIPPSFSLTMEIVSPVNRQVSFVEEWFDYKLNLVKFRYVPGPNRSLMFGSRPLTEVHDFGTGVAFIMDELLGNCTVLPIEHGMFDDNSVDVTDVHIRTALEIFHLDNAHVQYEGLKSSRSIPCDTWITQRTDLLPGSNLSATLEWCFRAEGWSAEEDKRSMYSGGTPVQMRFWLANTQYDYNIYHFIKSQPDIFTYDVSACFTNRRRRNFDFAVSGQFAQNVSANLQEFKLSVLASLVLATGLSPLRIANIRVVFLEDVHIRVELLDKAPVKGDVSQLRQPIELDEAANALLQAIKDNRLIIGAVGCEQQSHLGLMAVIPSSVIEYIHETDLPTPPPTSLPQSTVPIATVTTATVGTASPSSQRPMSSASQSVSLISTAPPAQWSGGDNQSSLLYTPGAMGGLGVGTFVLGTLLGTGSAFLYLRRTERNYS